MITILLLSILGGYGGCGDCCFRTPRPGQCSCGNCEAEAALAPAPVKSEPGPTIPIAEGKLQQIEANCRARGGWLEIQYVCTVAGDCSIHGYQNTYAKCLRIP